MPLIYSDVDTGGGAARKVVAESPGGMSWAWGYDGMSYIYIYIHVYSIRNLNLREQEIFIGSRNQVDMVIHL